MKHPGIVRTLGLYWVLGLVGFTVGCGSDAGQARNLEKGAGKVILEEQKNARKEMEKARAADSKKQRGDPKQFPNRTAQGP